MAWTFRKTKKIGPIRLSLSKQGIGFSLGVKGARVGITPRGDVYRTIGGAGLHSRKTILKAGDLSGKLGERLAQAALSHDVEPEPLDHESSTEPAITPTADFSAPSVFVAGVIVGLCGAFFVLFLLR